MDFICNDLYCLNCSNVAYIMRRMCKIKNSCDNIKNLWWFTKYYELKEVSVFLWKNLHKTVLTYEKS